MTPASPVGLFDSGLGGLSVLREVRRLLPMESLIYVADSAHVPYGEQTPEFIVERSLTITDFLLQQGIKVLVVACNTATAAAIGELRSHYPQLPIVGMEPAVKPATAATRSGIVGVLATTGTLKSARFAALLDRFAGSVRVITQPCVGLVELIEAGRLDDEETRGLLRQYVEPLLAQGCDTLILGCTHYPFIRPLLESIVPPSVAIIDTGAAVARRLQGLLAQSSLLASGSSRPATFYSSGNAAAFHAALPVLLGIDAPVSGLTV